MFRVGKVEVAPAIMLAPMEGVTDRAFRALIRHLGGVGLTVTEFVSSEGLTRDVESAWRMAELDPDEHPVSIQIYGRDAARMAQAAAHCQELGADIIDLNLGCPSKRVTSGCAGSALMKEPAVAIEIFRQVKAAITVPMTVKMRLGWDDSNLNAAYLVRAAQEEGAEMVTVHARTRQDGYKRAARWELAVAAREAVSVPFIINGDISCADSARRALEVTGADGIMIGRAVRQDPWTIARIAAEFEGRQLPPLSLDDRRAALDFYLSYQIRTAEFNRGSLNRFRGVAHACTRELPHRGPLREAIARQQDFEGLRQVVHEYLDAVESSTLSSFVQGR